jgi:general secretion pathway protein J
MRTDHGFTLLELILALTIVGTVVLLALGAFRIGQRSWEKGDTVSEKNQRLRIAVERVRQQLSAATVYIGAGDDDGVLGFEGDGAEIRFVSQVSLIPGQERGLVWVHYRIFETSDQDRVLGFYERPILALDQPPDEAPGPEAYYRLIVGMTDAVWEYRGGEEATAADNWRNTWDSTERLVLPAAVRLTFRSGKDAPLSVVVRLVNPTGES